MDIKTIKFYGIVKNVKYGKTTFTVYVPETKDKLTVNCPFFCPIRNGDGIKGTGNLVSGIVTLTSEPFVLPPVDKESVINCFMIALKTKWNTAANLYRDLEKHLKSDTLIVPFLNETAEEYCKHRNKESVLTEVLENALSLSSDKFLVLLNWWFNKYNMRNLYLLGLTRREINNSKMTTIALYEQCCKDPYVVPSIPLDKCVSICSRLEIPSNNTSYQCGKIIRVIDENMNSLAWTATPTKYLLMKNPELKQLHPILKSQFGMKAELETCYTEHAYKIETFLADYVADKIIHDGIPEIIHPPSSDEKLSEEQLNAIGKALNHKISIITGAPGTGKTLTLSQLIYNLDARGINYVVGSFTGKAVSRIREISNHVKPATLHRLIMNVKKDVTHVVIDEASMVTMELFYDFLRVYPDISNITLFGDIDQLPPIGWGDLLGQLIKSGKVPVYHLTQNYRVLTAEGEIDGIILNCTKLREWNHKDPFTFVETQNFRVLEGPMERVFDIVKACKKGGIKSHDLVVLCPYNAYLDRLNSACQEIYDGGSEFSVDSRGTKWIVGDPVMLTKNMITIKTYNGECGTVCKVDDHKIWVDFGPAGVHDFLLEPSRQVEDESLDMDSDSENDYTKIVECTVLLLKHSYAVTVNKFQGSEKNFVVFFVPEINKGGFINTNMIYTAISRAKRCIWSVVCDIEAFEQASVTKAKYRCDNLAKRLIKALT